MPSGRTAGCWALGGIFFLSGLLKIRNPLDFADRIHAFQILPDEGIPLVALGLPILEVAIGILLFLPGFVRTALMTSFFLLVMFTIGLVQAMVRDLNITCGCFGDWTFLDSQPEYAALRNLVLLILVIWIYRDRLRPDEPETGISS